MSPVPSKPVSTKPAPGSANGRDANPPRRSLVSWILLAVVVGAAGTLSWLQDARKRRRSLVAAPRSLTALKIAIMAAAGIAVVAICNVNRAHFGTIEGVPYIILIVLVVVVACTILLQRTRFGRYVYAIGGNPEAARRAAPVSACR